MDTKPYEDLIRTAQRAKEAGVECVLVYEPAKEDDNDSTQLPSMVVSSSGDAAVIAALLGNGFDDEEDEC
jgi:hypothetical protein